MNKQSQSGFTPKKKGGAWHMDTVYALDDHNRFAGIRLPVDAVAKVIEEGRYVEEISAAKAKRLIEFANGTKVVMSRVGMLPVRVTGDAGSKQWQLEISKS